METLWESCAGSVQNMNHWDQIRNYLQAKVSAEGYENWLKNALFEGVDGRTLLVSVPDSATRAWLETEYAGLIHSGIRDLNLPLNEVSYQAHAEHAARAQGVACLLYTSPSPRD